MKIAIAMIAIVWLAGFITISYPNWLEPVQYPDRDSLPLPASIVANGWGNEIPLLLFLPTSYGDELAQNIYFTRGFGPNLGYNGIELRVTWRGWDVMRVFSTQFAEASTYNVVEPEPVGTNRTYSAYGGKINKTIFSDALLPAGILDCSVTIYDLLYNQTDLELRIERVTFDLQACKGLNTVRERNRAGVTSAARIIDQITYHVPRSTNEINSEGVPYEVLHKNSTNFLLQERELPNDWSFIWAEVFIYNLSNPLVFLLERQTTYSTYTRGDYYSLDAMEDEENFYAMGSGTSLELAWSIGVLMGAICIVGFLVYRQRKQQQCEENSIQLNPLGEDTVITNDLMDAGDCYDLEKDLPSDSTT